MTNDKKNSKTKVSRRRFASRKTSAASLGVLLAALAFGVSGPTSSSVFAALQEAAPATPPPAAPAPAPAPAPTPETAPAAPEAAPEAPAKPTDAEVIAAVKKVGIESKEQIPNPVEDPAGAVQFQADIQEALANPNPPDPQESVAVKLVDFDPTKSYSSLLVPSVADRVGLSDAQREKVNELMTKRSQALAAAAKEDWNKITLDSEAELKALLTEEQSDRFSRGVADKTIVLRFNKEKWEDVLKWLASEIGLEIVMTAPPQGTFTYSDKTPYSPKDALDVVNGFLNFRGYTLIRYNEMLILHDFKRGSLPLQYLPKITPEDLPNQSRFDYVALTIPLERRSMNAVRQTIQPFLGPNCVVRAQGGNSLLVVDSVNALREIYAAATSVYNPDAPPEGPYGPRGPRRENGDRPERAPEIPEWRSFALNGVSHNVVEEQIATFAPEAKSLYNPTANVLHYLAKPSQLNIVEGLISRLQEGSDPAKNALAKVYSLENLASASPADVWAYSRRIGGQGSPFAGPFGPSAQEALFESVVASLQKIAPDAQIELSAANRKLFVVASAADHEKIAASFATLTADVSPSEEPVIKVYRFENGGAARNSTAVAAAIRVVAPFAQSTPTSDAGLLVIGTVAEQEAVAKTLEEFKASAEAPETKRELKVYSMTARQIQRFLQIYAQLASTPDLVDAVRVVDSASPNRIVFWARPAQHAQIAKIVDQITNVDSFVDEKAAPNPQGLPAPQDPAAPAPTPAPETPAAPAPAPETPPAPTPAPETPAAPAPAPAPETPPAPTPAPETPAAPAPAPAPETPPAPAPAPETPAAPAPTPAPETPPAPAPAQVAAQADLEKEAAKITAEQRIAVGESGAYMTVLPIKKISVATAQSLVLNSIPGIDVTIDYASSSLIIYGSKSNVEASAALLDQLENRLDVVLEIVPLTKELPTEALSAFPRVEPRVSATYDRANRRLFLFGNPTDILRLKKYVEQIESATTDEEDGVYYFDVDVDVPASILDFIKRAAPGAEVTYDSSNRRYTIVGTPTEQLAVAKLITDAANNLPPEDETKYYTLEGQVPDKLIELLNERVKNVKSIARDDRNPNVLNVVAKPFQHEKIAAAIQAIQEEFPLQDANTFVAYPTTKEVRARFSQVQNDFIKQNGSIKILQDDASNTFAVWALPTQHEALKQLLADLASVESGEKETATLYTPKRVDAATLVSILKDLQPNLTVTNDALNNRLILRGTSADLAEAKATLATLDVAEEDGVDRTFKSFPIKGFYSYDGVGNYYSPSYYVRDISKLVPAARVTYDYYNQAIVVWGTEEEQAIVEKAVSNLAEKDGLDQKILRWPVRRANYSTLISSIHSVCPGATPSYDSTSQSLIIRVYNSASLADVKELLELLDPEEVGDLDPILAYYDAGADPTEELVSSLQKLVPNAAKIAIDQKNRQICVIAKPAEQKIVADNIERLAKSFGSSDKRLIPYPVLGADLTALLRSMTTAYPNATIEKDDRENRLLVRATLDEHVKISEEIERINEGAADPTDANGATVSVGPRVVVYDAETQANAAQIRGIVANLFPGAEVFSGYGYGGRSTGAKVTVLANGREQKMIASIIDELKTPTDAETLQFAVYPFGELDGKTVDALVGNMIPTALAVPTLENIGPNGRNSFAQQRYASQQARQARLNYGGGSTGEAIPFYRIDETSKTVAVFANAEDHETVRDAIEKLSALSVEEAKSSTRVFQLAAPVAYQLYTAISQIAPSVEATPTSPREIVAYGPEAELAKVDEFFKGVAEGGDFDKTASKMRLFTLPENSRYLRDRVVLIVNANFARLGASAYPGAISDQVIVWGLDDVLDQIGQFVDELVAAPDEAVYKTFPIVNVPIPTAMLFLSKVCPNAELSPDPARKAIVAFGTPLQLASVENALKEIDAPTDPTVAPVVRIYNWEEQYSYWSAYSELVANFPDAVVTPNAAIAEIVVSASETTQAKIAAYIESRASEAQKRAYSMKAYYLTRVNFAKLVQMVPTLLPRVAVYPGKGANEIFVVATQTDHSRFAEFLSQVESVEAGAEANGIAPKIYRVSGQAASAAIGILAPQVPGAVMYPLTGNRILVWGGAADQEYVAKNLDSLAEAFPEATLKKYPLQHLKYADVVAFVTNRFAGEGVFYASSDGDLMCQASEIVQEEVAKLLAELDVEGAAETRAVPVAYDITDVPIASLQYAAAAIARTAPEAIQFPTTTPGFLVISARPATHEKIAEIVAEMVKERPALKQKMVAYTVRRMTLAQLAQLLVPLYPNIKIGAGTTSNQIIILAKPDEHEKIAALIDQLNAETDDGMTSRVYRLKNSQLYVAREAILTMYPQAVVITDQLSRSLMVKAYSDQLDKIEQLVAEIDEKDPERNSSFRVFNIGTLSFSRLLASLRNFYANDPAFQVQLDSSNQCLIVRGTAIQHKAVEELIEEVRAGGLADPEAYMQTYTLKNQSALTSLYSIFYEQGRDINMYRDYSTGKLVVIGRPEEHKMVQNILDVVAPEETELAVFDLVYVDPSTARQVFGMIETDGTYVDVRYDANSNQLFVRATLAKLEEIRQVLIKMGEKDLEKMKPFAQTTEGGGASTDGRRIYLRDDAKRDEAETKTTGSVDLKNLEPIAPPKNAVATEKQAPKTDEKTAQPASIKVEATGPMRTVTVEGADANKILQEALNGWNRENDVKVVEGDGGLVQEKENATPPGGSAKSNNPPAGDSAAPAPAEEPVQPTPAPAPAEEPVQPTPAPAPAEEPVQPVPAPAAAEEPVQPAPAPAAAEEPVQPVPAPAPAEEPVQPVPAPAPAEEPVQPVPAPAAAEEPVQPVPAPAPAEEPVQPAPAPVPAEEPKTEEPKSIADSAISALFFSLSRSTLTAVSTGALVLDGDAPAQPLDLVAETAAKETQIPTDSATPAEQTPTSSAAPKAGVYVVVNPDGTMTLASTDQDALEELQRRLAAAVEKTNGETSSKSDDSSQKSETSAPSDPTSRNYLSYMTQENLDEARGRVLMESRNYTVYKVENVGVNQLVPRLQTYMSERTSQRGGGYGGYGFDNYYGYSSGGINMRTISSATQLSFQPDVALNTVTVYGSKADRDAAGAMIVLLDKVDLFPQPITKPYKIKVVNTSPTRMAQQVLNAFSRKFQTTLLPGNMSPRISPNLAANSLEVYAPEALAKEIEEYVQEVDKEILEDSVRKVRVVELKSMNSTVLSKYLQNLSSRQTVSPMLSTPYIGGTTPFMPPMINRGGYGGQGGGYGGYPGQYGRNRGF